MTHRILAVQRGHCWSFNSTDAPNKPGRLSPYTVALTGFISNLAELEKRYALPSCSSLSPTDRLSQLFAQDEERVLGLLRGNFAVLIVRSDRGQLWAKRDRLGAHSLYLARRTDGQGWVVGNSAADVFRASGHGFEEDSEYLAGYFSLSGQKREGLSAFRCVQSLLPGELLTIDGQRMQRHRSPIQMANDVDWSSEAEAIEKFKSLLESSVSHCLATDTDSAVMLSGGLDSGPVAIIGDRVCRSRGRALIPISWSLRDFPDADETPWVDQLAQDLSTPLVRLEASALLPFSDVASTPVNPESPSFNAFRPLANQCYSTASAMGCSVILNGNAGDELYPDFHILYRGYLAKREWQHLLEDLTVSFRRGGWKAVWSKPPLRDLLKQPLRRFRRQQAPAWLTKGKRKYWSALDIWPPECREHWLPEYAEQLYGRNMASGRAQEYFQSCELGVERRDPYHNEELVAFMLQAPFSFSFRQHRSKWIMREAMRGELPEIFRRKRRTGLMGSFYRAGKRANRSAIASFLFDEHREWQRWIRPDAVRSTLDDDNNKGPASLLVDRCIGYVNWLRYWHSA